MQMPQHHGAWKPIFWMILGDPVPFLDPKQSPKEQMNYVLLCLPKKIEMMLKICSLKYIQNGQANYTV
jgi:hypothetical protein